MHSTRLSGSNYAFFIGVVIRFSIQFRCLLLSGLCQEAGHVKSKDKFRDAE